MSIQCLRASLELLDTTPGAESSYNAPSRTIYHQTSRDVMLIQGIHYAVEEALANVGELESLDPLFNPSRRCLLRLQQNLIDIARISENIQESILRNIINNPPTSTSQTQIIGEEPTSQSVAEDCGSVSLPTASVSTNPRSEGSDEPTISLLEPLPCRSDPNRKPVMSSPSENLMHQATPDRDYRFKRERPNDGDHVPQPPPVKRPRHSPNGSIYLRPACQKREHTSVFSWARWMFTAPRQ